MYLLLISCPDRKGLVHQITGVLFRHQLNVLSNGEYVDPDRNLFFMRTEFSGSFERKKILDELHSVLPEQVQIQLTPRRKNIVILASKEPYCLGDLLLRHAYDELNARILAVISNHPVLEPLVRKFSDIPFHHIPHEGKSREEHEELVRDVLREYSPEYVVLAKYMRILTPAFTNEYPHRIINIHHSFLPAFIGANPYKQAHERGVKIIGATAHFVNEKLDEGPIIAQSVIPVDHSQNVQAMTRAGREIEKLVLAKALNLVFEDRVFVSGNRTVIFE